MTRRNKSTENGKPYNWTPREIETLRRLHGSTRVRDLVPILGRSKDAVVGKMKHLGLPFFDPSVWTAEQIEMVRSAVPGTPARRVARKAGHTARETMHKAAELGVTLVRHLHWTPEQVELLRAKGAALDCAKLAALTGKSPRGVRSKADALGIRVKASARMWGPKKRRTPGKRRGVVDARAMSPAAGSGRPMRLVPARKRSEASRLEWCPECGAPVSNWQQHTERMEHRRRP